MFFGRWVIVVLDVGLLPFAFGGICFIPVFCVCPAMVLFVVLFCARHVMVVGGLKACSWRRPVLLYDDWSLSCDHALDYCEGNRQQQ